MTPEQFDARVNALSHSHKILKNFPIDNIKEALTDKAMFGPQKAHKAIKQFLNLYQALFLAFKDLDKEQNLDNQQRDAIRQLRTDVEHDLFSQLEEFKSIADDIDLEMPENLAKVIPSEGVTS